MSSNVGLTTPRGSGTSGYVQRNAAFLRPRDGPPQNSPFSTPRPTHTPRSADASILLHEQKRSIEISCLELQDELEEAGKLSDEAIAEEVDKLRQRLLREFEERGSVGDGRGVGRGGQGRREFKSYEVHEMAVQKEKEDERFRNALGIGRDYEEGGHWRRQEEDRERRARGEMPPPVVPRGGGGDGRNGRNRRGEMDSYRGSGGGDRDRGTRGEDNGWERGRERYVDRDGVGPQGRRREAEKEKRRSRSPSRSISRSPSRSRSRDKRRKDSKSCSRSRSRSYSRSPSRSISRSRSRSRSRSPRR